MAKNRPNAANPLGPRPAPKPAPKPGPAPAPAPVPQPGPPVPNWTRREAFPLSLLREILAARGLFLASGRGQNLLVEPSVQTNIVRKAGIAPGDVVLEVGPGAGGLTGPLLEAGARVLAVEIDRGIYELCAERFAGAENLTLLHADALAGKHALNPELEKHLRLILAEPRRAGGEELKLVSNLPYSIATSLLITFAQGSLPWERIIATVQREVAERLIAPPGAAQYGASTVALRSVAEVDFVRALPPTVFWPVPNVESAIIEVRPRTGPAVRASVNSEAFGKFVRDLFSQRRKTIAVSLRHMGGGNPAWRRAIKPALEETGIEGIVRAETLPPEQFEALFRAIMVRLGGK